ncbi:MAG: ASKHA domain-containing protein [Treponema sp.]|jgi:uncharacterized 2Fe-2S/4Fe-4S cluster protein (DUF4445 family)|nr:ASKHA domain-containing protein [Treponema sp.]
MKNKIARAGVGLDIGTTTVQAQLIDLDTGNTLESVSVLNVQREFGTDVMSRIACARAGKLRELYTAINKQVQVILHQFMEKWNLSGIDLCTVSGNTTMLHLFINVNPHAMGEAPYSPEFLEERHFNGSDLSLPAEQIILLPGISAFIGADIVAGLTFLDVINKKNNMLFVDIGTNGEIVVWKGSEKRLLCCSTAAGPCFEGEAITYGSDLIDAIARMKQQGIVDKTGAMKDSYVNSGFISEKGFTVTQETVRLFQLAKSAIYSGISVLCRTVGMKPSAFDEVYIAGRMGFYINLENAAETGLLPREFTKGVQVCENTSLKGAVKGLTDCSFLQKCKDIIAHSVTIDLAVDREFADAYIENMWL